jgi:receptor protein-tyrosine kinase
MSIVERALAKAALGKARATDTPPSGRLARRAVSANEQASEAAQDARAIMIGPEQLHRVGLAVPQVSEQRIAEELRDIKRPLLLNAERDSQVPNGNLVMMGSALPGAGKSFLSVNLALSMASDLDWKVLLIDADISRPTLSRGLGVGDAPGLVDLLEHERAALSDHIFRTNHPDLNFLPAGPQQSHAKELLGSQRMRTLLADLTARHPRQIILFDSPPLLLTSEARVLASYVGQIVLVVEAGHTPRRSVLEAIELLDRSKAINLVLNKSRKLVGIGDYNYGAYELYGRDNKKKTEG